VQDNTVKDDAGVADKLSGPAHLVDDLGLEVQDKIIRLIAKVKDDPGVAEKLSGPAHLVDDLGLDSLQLINLILLVEDEFDVQVDFASFQMEHLSSLERFTTYVSGLPKA